MRKENKDIVGKKIIWYDSGKLAYSDEEKKKAWKEHYERLLNVELPWSEEDLSVADPVLGPPTLVTREMAEKSINKIKKGKALGPSGVVTEMFKASSDICDKMILILQTPLFVTTQCLTNGMISSCIKVKVKLWIERVIRVWS